MRSRLCACAIYLSICKLVGFICRSACTFMRSICTCLCLIDVLRHVTVLGFNESLLLTMREATGYNPTEFHHPHS